MSKTLRRSAMYSEKYEPKRKDRHARGKKCYKESTCKPGCWCKVQWNENNSRHTWKHDLDRLGELM